MHKEHYNNYYYNYIITIAKIAQLFYCRLHSTVNNRAMFLVYTKQWIFFPHS
jgi:hypothetical protein